MQKQHTIYTPVILTLIILAHYLFSSISFTFAAGNTNDDPVSLESKLDPLDQELAWLYAEADYVSIATKSKLKVSEAPSIVTVITEEEIRNSGLRLLTEVFAMVPGFDVIKSPGLGQVSYGVRGVVGSVNKVKVLVDGHSLNEPFTGSAREFFDDLPLKNVKRIEIIRGPGSALYGENAFLGVVNIITKTADDIDGLEVSTGFGSYDTQEYNILYGDKFFGIDIDGFANYYNTNGLSEEIKTDALTNQPFFNRFSLAPGDTDDSRNRLDTYIKASYGGFGFKGRYTNKDREQFIGPDDILVDDVDQFLNYAMGELSYAFEIGEKTAVASKIYYDQYDMEFDLQTLPDGFVIPADLDNDGDIEIFPDGHLFDVFVTNRRLGSDIQFDYALSENNDLTVGFNYIWEKQDNVQTYSNTDAATGAYLGTVRNVSDTANWLSEATRQIWAIYFQDIWNITDDLGLTIGVRHDHYSDFEGTTNPRLGVVWNFIDKATLKALYGQAFRAPTFAELYLTNNSVELGSPDLQPETIRTYEVGLGYKFSKITNINVNYFFNVIRDQISYEPLEEGSNISIVGNFGGSNIQGVELEANADLGFLWNGAQAFANYTYQDAESKGDPITGQPRHKGNVGVNAGIGKYLNANIHAFISDERIRHEVDTRDDSPGYALLNLTLTAKEFFKTMTIKASMFNLLDKDYNDPAAFIPTDLPRPGRTFFVEVGYDF